MIIAAVGGGMFSERAGRLARTSLHVSYGIARDRQLPMVTRLHALLAAPLRYGYWRIAALLR